MLFGEQLMDPGCDHHRVTECINATDFPPSFKLAFYTESVTIYCKWVNFLVLQVQPTSPENT